MYLLHCAWIINYFLKLPQITVICLKVSAPKFIHLCTFSIFDKKCNLLLEHLYGNTGRSDNSSRTSRPSTPIYYHARKSGDSEKLSIGVYYKPEWQRCNICGIKQQGCWFPTWSFIVYTYGLSWWFQPIFWTLKVPLPSYRTKWEHYTWQQRLLINT